MVFASSKFVRLCLYLTSIHLIRYDVGHNILAICKTNIDLICPY